MLSPLPLTFTAMLLFKHSPLSRTLFYPEWLGSLLDPENSSPVKAGRALLSGFSVSRSAGTRNQASACPHIFQFTQHGLKSWESMLQAALVFFKQSWLSLAPEISEPPVWTPERNVSLCLFFKQLSFVCSSHPWHLLNHLWSLAACTSKVSSQLFSMNIT